MATGIRAAKAFIIIEALDKTNAVFRSVSARFNRLGSSLISAGKKLAFGLTAAMTPVSLSTKRFADFDDALRRVEGRSKGTATEMEEIRKQAKELGRTTSFTASQVGELQEQLARKGFSRGQILEATQSILNLARAGGTGDPSDTVTAADLVSGAIRSFGLEAKDAGSLADLFTFAANNSALSLEDIRESLSKVGPLAKQFGSSVEDITILSAILANVNIQAAESGTSIRNMFLELSTGKLEEFRDVFRTTFGKDIDINITPLRGLSAIMGDIFQELNKISAKDATEMLSIIFGKRVIVKAGAIGQARDEFIRLSEEVKNIGGLAQTTADKFDSGLGGAFRKTLSAIEGVAIALGGSLAPALTDVSTGLIPLLNDMAQWIELNNDSVIAMVKMGVEIGKIAIALITLGTALKTLALLVNPVGAALVVLEVASRAFGGSFFGRITKEFDLVIDILFELEKQSLHTSKALKDMANAAKIGVELSRQNIGEDLTKRAEAADAAAALVSKISMLEDMLNRENLTGTPIMPGMTLSDRISRRHGGVTKIDIGGETREADYFSDKEIIRKELVESKRALNFIRVNMSVTREQAEKTRKEMEGIMENTEDVSGQLDQQVKDYYQYQSLAEEKAKTEEEIAKTLKEQRDEYLETRKVMMDLAEQAKRDRAIDAFGAKQDEFGAIDASGMTDEQLRAAAFGFDENLRRAAAAEFATRQENKGNDINNMKNQPLEVSQALQRGTVEATQQFLESRRGDEKQLQVLQDIRDNTDPFNIETIRVGDSL